MKKFHLLLIFFLLANTIFSQKDTTHVKSVYDMTLEELMQLEVNVTTIDKSINRLEAPGIISIVNEDDISSSGARDLIDILQLIPGFSFALDTQGQVGIMNRGNWAHENKILLMIDGLTINEQLYSTTVFGNHLPIENIHSIEIIRGPGSAIFGGNAEMSVISIITKSAKQTNGISAGLLHGSSENEFRFQESAYIAAGKQLNDLEFTIFGKFENGYRSDKDYQDMYGNAYNMLENQLNSMNVNISLKYKDLEFRTIYDNYQTTTRDFFGSNLSKAYPMNFTTYLAEAKYAFKINEHVKLTSKFNFKKDIPWNCTETATGNENADYYIYNRSVNRYSGNLISSFSLTQQIDFALGADYSYDFTKDHTTDADNVFWNGQKTIVYQNYAIFFQWNLNNRFFNTTIGARYDKHNQYGGAFVPRIAIMKRISKFNVKLLYNKAFKAPSIENIDKNYYLYQNLGKPVITPEITDVYNFEIGYQANSSIYLNVNLFRIDIDKTIVYSVSKDGVEGYDNIGKTGSQGIEAELKTKLRNISFNLNYSFYTTKNINKIEDYSVPTNENALLASPQHKITALTGIKLNENAKFSFSVIYFGKRYGYTTYNQTIDDVQISEFKPVILTNLAFNYNKLLLKEFNIGSGVY